MYAVIKTAPTCGTIALPAPRRMPTRLDIPEARGKMPGSIRLVFPSAQEMWSAPHARPCCSAVRPLICRHDPCSSSNLGTDGRGSLASPTQLSVQLLPGRCRRSGFGPAPASAARSPGHLCASVASATHQSRCLMCGALTPAAHRSAAPTAYPRSSRSARTPVSHSRPSLLATCSPKQTGGRHSAMSA